MTKAIDNIKNKAKAKNLKAVFAESADIRVLQAIRTIADEQIATPILVGNQDEISKSAREFSVDLNDIEIVDPLKSIWREDFVNSYFKLRQHKNITLQDAQEQMADPLYFATMMLANNKADGLIAGAVYTTADVLRSAIQIIPLEDSIDVVSSCFLMSLPEQSNLTNKVLIYADGAVVPFPDSRQLASIAISSARTFKKLLDIEPKVAMLSFSTKGSASHKKIDKILEAIEIAKVKEPNLIIDGEFQADTALVADIASRKAPDSQIQGDANVLIFPDLNSGNIAYKLTERLAMATATGPIIQGLSKPVSDLSRGCNSSDIVDATAITMVLNE